MDTEKTARQMAGVLFDVLRCLVNEVVVRRTIPSRGSHRRRSTHRPSTCPEQLVLASTASFCHLVLMAMGDACREPFDPRRSLCSKCLPTGGRCCCERPCCGCCCGSPCACCGQYVCATHCVIIRCAPSQSPSLSCASGAPRCQIFEEVMIRQK